MHLKVTRLFVVIVALIILIGALFFTPLSIFAQEVTPEPTEVVQPADPPVVTVPLDYLWSMQSLASYAVIFAGILGTVAVGGSLLLINRQSKDALEKVEESSPPEHHRTATRIIDFAEGVINQLVEFVKLAREVTDGKPNVDPADTIEVPRASPSGDP